MKIVIPGGSGQVGTLLARSFVAAGHDVVVLSRKPGFGPWRSVGWDGKNPDDWTSEIDGADAVINLAGRSVNCRYGKRNRRLIMDSRVNSTRVVGEAISNSDDPPKIWLQASTATIYAHRYDAPNDEHTGILGGTEDNVPDKWRFSIDVAKNWERAANEANTPETRKVLLRSAMIMSPDRGGIFDVLYRLTRWGLGGKAGDGRQFVSWIHEYDFINAVNWLIEHEHFKGPVNLASPNPLPHTDFMQLLRDAAGVRVGLPATKSMLEFGTFLMRTESELVLKSRRVTPGKLFESGFGFQFERWTAAAAELCGRRETGAPVRFRVEP